MPDTSKPGTSHRVNTTVESKAAEKGLLIKPFLVLKDKVRLVFYKDISKEDTEKAVALYVNWIL